MNKIIFILLLLLIVANSLNDARKLRNTRRYLKSKHVSFKTMTTESTSAVVASSTTNSKMNSIDEHDVHSIVNITVKVGETITLKCSIDYRFENNAGVIWMRKSANVLTLNTNRITEDQRFDVDYQHQNERHNYHLTLKNIQISDESEYICETSSTIDNYEYTTIHSLIYLHVTRE